jgi:copper resistance protein D
VNVDQLLDIFGFLSVLLRGSALAFEALTLGGIIFVFVILREPSCSEVSRATRLWLRCFASLLAVTQVCILAMNSAILANSTGLRLIEIAGAAFWVAGALSVSGATGVLIFAASRWFPAVSPFAFAFILAGSVTMSHSVARLDHRWVLVAFTLVHHVATAAWIGGLPYLLMALRRTTGAEANAIAARFSKLAMVSVALLIGAGVTLAVAYVGSFTGMLGATYGVMLSTKVILTAILLLLGALNFRIVRAAAAGRVTNLPALRRFAEAEAGIGFTVLLAAASLTSTPPAIDVHSDQVPLREIAERLRPRWPRMQTPSVTELSPVTPLTRPPRGILPESFVPGQSRNSNGPADIAWSEYNHHWAGLVVLCAGILAVVARKFRWARGWPLAFLGLATFLLIRADSENWPLGPRGFWESFRVAEVAQHRFFVLLIVAFAVFEWGIQTRRVMPRGAAFVFPSVCVLGGALLMTHSHSLGNVREELLAEWSHMPIAVLGVVAGWSRWLELRLPGNLNRIPAWIWPPCFVLIGLILVLYRES